MQYFLDTTETIPSGVGFTHFGGLHFLWLAIFLLSTALVFLFYQKSSDHGRCICRKVIAILLVADEIFKDVMLFVGGRFLFGYLPLHLCSINIFVIAYHAWKPGRAVGGYLYTVGIPGALAALLFPTWTSLPLCNFMHLHSFTVHILLAMYPLVLAMSGEIQPTYKQIHKYLGILVVLAIPIYILNLLLDTNFMFLMSVDPGNPLYLFQQMWGNHLLGFPVIIAGVLLVMYLPLELHRAIKHRKNNGLY